MRYALTNQKWLDLRWNPVPETVFLKDACHNCDEGSGEKSAWSVVAKAACHSHMRFRGGLP